MASGDSAILGLKPGLGFRPMVDFLSTLVRYVPSDPQTYLGYVQNLRAFTEVYESTNLIDNEGFTDCSINGPRGSSDPIKVCKFYLSQLGNCQRQNNYGFDRNRPCFILKINNLYGWVPEIENTTMSLHPLVRCTGQNIPDFENFGNVTYSPGVNINGLNYGVFNSQFYPYLVQASYRQPLVSIQFLNPTRYIVLMVHCKLYNVRNVNPDGVKFELLVD